MDRKNILKQYLISPEEMESYSELPLDEYTQKNEPELYDKIEHAKRIKEAIGMSSDVGGPMGMIGAVSNLTKNKAFSNILNLIKTRDPKIKEILEKVKNFPEKEKEEFLDYYEKNTNYFPQNETQSLGTRISGYEPKTYGKVFATDITPKSGGVKNISKQKQESLKQYEELKQENKLFNDLIEKYKQGADIGNEELLKLSPEQQKNFLGYVKNFVQPWHGR